MRYVDVPVLFSVFFEGDFAKPYLMTGVNFGIPLENTKVKIENVKANGENVIELIPNDLIEQELKIESLD